MSDTVYFTISSLPHNEVNVFTKNSMFSELNCTCKMEELFNAMDSITIIVNDKNYACLFEVN